MTSTAIKLVGGVSGKDANAFAREMRCDPEFLQNMRKGDMYTQFACFVRNVTTRPVPLTVPFGQLEARPRLTQAQYDFVIERNRARFASKHAERPAEEDNLSTDPSDPDLL